MQKENNMRVKNGFVMRQLGEEYVVVPVGAAVDQFQGMIRLNETGAFLWKRLQSDSTEVDLLQALQAEYDVSEEKAASDLEKFLDILKEEGILEL